MTTKADDKMVIGIVGGMGSYATADFFYRILDAFPAEKEWDRPRVLIDNNCTMPSRVRAVLYNENCDVLETELANSIQHLVDAGATHIILVCNTSHVFLPNVLKMVPEAENKIVHIIEALKHELMEANIKEIYLMATEGTIISGIYHDILSDADIKCVTPKEHEFPLLRDMIEAVKCNQLTESAIDKFIDFIVQSGHREIVLGCTELPVLYQLCHERPELKNIRIHDPLNAALRIIKNDFKP